MAFCKYCGRQLGEGMCCTCEEAVEAAAANAGAAEAGADKPVIEADTDTGRVNDNCDNSVQDNKAVEDDESSEAPAVISPPVPVNTISGKLLRRGMILVCAMALVLVLFVVVVGNVVGSGYRRPLDNAVKGINREKSVLIINSFYPSDYVDELRDEAEDNDDDWRDVTDDLDSLISDVKEVCEDGYFGDDLKVSARIVKKKSATSKELRTLKKEFESYDAVVKKAYRLKVRLVVRGNDDREQMHFYIYSVKLKGGRWVLFADDKTKGTVADKAEDIYKALEGEIGEIFDDYSRSMEIFQ